MSVLRITAAALSVCLLMLCAPSCTGGVWVQLNNTDYELPPDKVVDSALAIRISGSAMNQVTERIGVLLPRALGQTKTGWSCFDADELLESGQVSVPITLGPLTGNVGARSLNICVDLKSLEVEFVEGSDPAQLSLKVEKAKVGFANPAVLFGSTDLILTETTVACVIDNALDLASDQPYLTEVSFESLATLSVDEKGGFSVQSTTEKIVIHELGAKVTKDCTLVECADANPGGIGSPCVECELCTGADIATQAFDILYEIVGQLLDPFITDVLDDLGKQLFDQLLNGRPLNISAEMDLSNAMGAVTDSARTIKPVGLMVRPAPSGIKVSGVGQSKGLDLNLQGGSVNSATHPCIPPVDVEPQFLVPPFPQLTGTFADGTTYEVGVAMSEAFVNQLLWSVYRSGGLCLAFDSSEVADLTGGEYEVKSSLLDLLIPGASELARNTGGMRIRLLPNIAVSDFPIVDFDESSGRISLKLNRFGVGVEVFSHGDYMRLITVTSDLILTLELKSDSSSALSLNVIDLTLGETSVTGPGFSAARVDLVMELAVQLLLSIFNNTEPFNLSFDTNDLLSILGDFPIQPKLVGIEGIDGSPDWLALYLALETP